MVRTCEELTEVWIVLPGYNQIKQCKQGWMVYNKNDKYLGHGLEVYGEFSEAEVDAFKMLIPKGGLVVEVGANMGAHTIAFANIVGSEGAVIAFEPQRLMYITLCANVAINSFYNVYCQNAAVSDAPGQILVPVLDPNKEASFGSLSLELFGGAGDPVPVTTLDDLNVGRCNFIKIDVEGMEQKVIAGGKNFINKHRPYLYVENDRPENIRDLVAEIAALDYDLYWHITSLFNPNNYCGVAENIFHTLVSSNMLCVPSENKTEIVGLERVDPEATAVPGVNL